MDVARKVRKVVILGSAHPLRGGLAAYNERLARALIKHGDQVKLINFSLQYPGFLFPGKTQFSNEPPPNDLDIETCVNSINPINWIRVGWRIKKMQPDLLIIKFWIPFMGPCLGSIARIVRKNRKTKIISILDNIVPHEKRPGDRLLSAYFVKAVDGFIAMSKQVLDDLDLFDKKKAREFCPHPLYDHFGDLTDKPTAITKLGLDESSKYILFFGFIRDYKGLDILLDAMAKEKLEKLKLKLLVAGEFYTDSKPYFEKMEKLGLQDRVVMSNDFIPDGEVANFFNAADIVVQPYKNATQSGVTQIAYHFEKPMITTNVGGLAEIVPNEKVGFVVNPDTDEITEAIFRFYNENREDEFISNIKIEKLKYSWERMIETIDKLIKTK
ncbi:MAG: glycosyltransferase [Bacteroidales bacterium]|jgi:glycosyltransferase involved in cell wall biosynthesis